MQIVVVVPIAALATAVIVIWLLIGVWRAKRRRVQLARLRARQEAARIRVMEKALRPSLWQRLVARKDRV